MSVCKFYEIRMGDDTMKLRNKLILLLLVCLLLSTSCLPAFAAAADEAQQDAAPVSGVQQSLTINAKAAMLVDLNTGRVVYEQNADEIVYPASLTKIMTCLLALENGNLSSTVTVSEAALSDLDPNSSTAGLQVGEQMTLENMLYCMMIPSGNEACNAVAEHIAGSVSDFVRMMNERAYELGCENTHFSNPHGLHEQEHYTTARDLVKITQAALKSENFKQIVNTPEYELPATNLSEPRTLRTTNQLIYKNSNNSYYYPRAMGIKTGYTSAAGRCVISCAKDDELYFLAVVCGAETVIQESGDLLMQSFPECIRLFDYGFDNFSYVTAVSPLYPIAQVAVSHTAGAEAVALAPAREIKVLLPNDYDSSLLTQDITLQSQSVEAPVRAGDVLGKVSISYHGELLGETELLAIADVARSEFSAAADNTGSYIQKNWWKWVVIVIVLFVVAFLVLLLVLRLRQQRQRLRRLEQRRRALEQRERNRRMGGGFDDDEA